MAREEIWSEELDKWVKAPSHIYWIDYSVDHEQFSIATSKDFKIGKKLYHYGYPWIADKWYKEIVAHSKDSSRPAGERTYEVTNMEGKKGLYISRNHFIKNPELIIPEEFDFIRPTTNAIGVRSHKGSGVYSYEGKLLIPEQYGHIYFSEKCILAIKDTVKDYENKFDIFSEYYETDSASYNNEQYFIMSAYLYDGTLIFEGKYEQLEDKGYGIRAWMNIQDYKLFSYTGNEIFDFNN